MKKFLLLDLILIALIISSCTEDKKIGIWDDLIKLSIKPAEFSPLGDSKTIETGGDWWWVSDISVDDKWYYGFTGIDLESDYYRIEEDCYVVERRDKNTLFIQVDANPKNSNRIITVGLHAGDYGDRVTIAQKG
jgi:hypothetical protein